MMKRLLLTASFFVLFSAVLILPVIVNAKHSLDLPGNAGTGLVLGSPAQMASRLVVLLLLAIAAYWIAGRLVRA